jgi:hypothetical protein
LSGTDGVSGEDGTDTGVLAAPLGQKPKPIHQYDLYGRAGFDRVNIFEKPDMESPRIGYLRMGAVVRVGNPEYSSESCPGGWFGLEQGGYACQGRGLLVGHRPKFIKEPPPSPSIDSIEPYRHGFVRKDWTPSYKRLPRPEELWTPPTETLTDNEVDTSDAGPTLDPIVIPHKKKGGGADTDTETGLDYHDYAKKNFKTINQFLSRGFWISVADRIADEQTRKQYYKTIKGDFIPAETVHLVVPPSMRGYRVTGETPLPAVIVTDRKATFHNARGNRFGGAGPAERFSSFPVRERRKVGGTEYFRVDDKRWVRSNHVELFELSEPPEGVSDKEKWIRVDLTRQTLEAYEGTAPYYVTVVSTGLPNDGKPKLLAEHTETPRGEFRIEWKHVTDDMAGAISDEDAYSVEDVPWAQYVHRNIAIHAAFWHTSFGRPRSRGCINLTPADARALFHWTDPQLPEDWHAVAATPHRPGTRVFIVGNTPEVKGRR